MRHFKLQIIQTLVLLVCLSQTLAQEVMAQGIESVGTDYQAILYYGKPDAGDSNDPTVFMSEPNQTIINNVKNLGCNTIFFSVSTYGSVPNENDLGLNPYPGYRDKVVDFLDLCANQNIKVFALTLDEPSYVLTANHQTALDKLFKVAYYQKYVRNLANQPQYFAKKAHFHGVVTNLEAWAAPGWNDNLCESTYRQQANNILGQYLDLIPQMYTLLADNDFFSPPVAPGYIVQPLDGKFMGTVHWAWHYFEQMTSNFPNGNFSLYTGERNGNHYFDILLPETYCPKGSNDCMSLPCVDSYGSLCEKGFYKNYESVGDCYQWFDNHFISGYATQGMTLKPIDAAPLLYGHSAYMFDRFSDLNFTRWASKWFTKSCKSKSNYKGSFVFKYHQAIAIPRGVDFISTTLCNSVISPPTDISVNLESREIYIYPNPFTSSLTIQGLMIGDKVRLYNFDLDIINETYDSLIFTASIPEGIYFIHVVDKDGNIVAKRTLNKTN